MPKPKAFLVDWLAEARALSGAIGEISGPPGLLCDPNTLPGLLTGPSTWEPDRTKLAPIRHLMDLVRVFLTDRIGRKTPTRKPKHGYSYGVFTDDPMRTWPLLSMFTGKLGMTFTDTEYHAFLAHNMLGVVLRDGWISDFDRRQLPVQIASIQGESASSRASKSARNERKLDRRTLTPLDRRSALTRLIAEERGRDPDATPYEVLDRLCNGPADVRDVVQGYKNDRLYYRDVHKKDREMSVSVGQYLKLFAQSNPGG